MPFTQLHHLLPSFIFYPTSPFTQLHLLPNFTFYPTSPFTQLQLYPTSPPPTQLHHPLPNFTTPYPTSPLPNLTCHTPVRWCESKSLHRSVRCSLASCSDAEAYRYPAQSIHNYKWIRKNNDRINKTKKAIYIYFSSYKKMNKKVNSIKK